MCTGWLPRHQRRTCKLNLKGFNQRDIDGDDYIDDDYDYIDDNDDVLIDHDGGDDEFTSDIQ